MWEFSEVCVCRSGLLSAPAEVSSCLGTQDSQNSLLVMPKSGAWPLNQNFKTAKRPPHAPPGAADLVNQPCLTCNQNSCLAERS